MPGAPQVGGVGSGLSGRPEVRAGADWEQHGAVRQDRPQLTEAPLFVRDRHDLSPSRSDQYPTDQIDEPELQAQTRRAVQPLARLNVAQERASSVSVFSAAEGNVHAPLSYGLGWRALRYPLLQPVHQVQQIGSSGAHLVATSSSVVWSQPSAVDSYNEYKGRHVHQRPLA